jgi:hypothetical protein
MIRTALSLTSTASMIERMDVGDFAQFDTSRSRRRTRPNIVLRPEKRRRIFTDTLSLK